MVAVKESESAEYIAKQVKKALDTWNIPASSVICLTTDGAANCKASAPLIPAPWLLCVAHALNRSIHLALQEDSVEPILHKAKKVANFFRRSPAAQRELSKQQYISKESTKKLKIDNNTRWSSCCKMLLRLQRSMVAINAALAELQQNQVTRKAPPPTLTSPEWIMLSEITTVLLPLRKATKAISAEKAPTISQVMPMIAKILWINLAPSNDDTATVASFKSTLKMDLNERWGIMISNIPDHLLLAVYLDPRMKDFAFLTQGRDLAVKARDLTFRKLEPLLGTISAAATTTASQMNDKERAATILLYGAALVNRPATVLPASSEASALVLVLKQEVWHYFNTAPVDLCTKISALEWWKSHEVLYPNMSVLAKHYLCITASSVPCERVFSKGGWLVSKRRSSLSPNTVSQLMFLACNTHHSAH